MRERLIELLKVPIYPKEGVDLAEVVADYLLDNGVIVPPCKVGDKVWCIDGFCDESFEVVERIIVSFTKFKNSIHFYAEKPTNPGWGRTYGVDNFGKTVFITREEAEAALKGRESNGRK